ncbi:hypothetical protein [Caenispirillum bisanense]|uniref:Uncharacterized protein n=1 Tax=Caenispirillum bisanense TaxID=414052 RepID=A0A286GW86_9PROT|nr:hypothetical protein [Caenispirillum bisanense]SOD99446.1 hypothetical protein SAMN05421508_10916 [Caenispirillum bisanense]
MALINRWQLSNFLNSGDQRKWSPDFIGETIDVGGGSAALVMDNGTGKTSMADALLFTLSMNPVLRKRTLGRVAPERFGYFTHVRVEFVVPDEDGQLTLLDLGAADPGGEYHVFGMFGVRGADGSLDYNLYYYPGRLEDVPVHVEEPGDEGLPIKSLLPNIEFRNNLEQTPGYRVFSPKSDMELVLRNFMSLEQRDQLVAYQCRGGGDKSAAFYDVRPRPGETYDRAFFRQVIAPIILSNPAGINEDGERTTLSLEEEIISQSDKVIEAKMKTEEHGRQVARLEQVFGAISEFKVHADKALQAEDARATLIADKGGTIHVAHMLIEDGLLPGAPLPVSRKGRFGADWELLSMAGAEPGLGYVVDRDKLSQYLRTPGAFKGLTTLRDSQVIPFSTANIARGISGHDSRAWLRLQDVHDALDALADVTRREARSKLDALTDVVLAHARHPVRNAEREAREAVDDLNAEIHRESRLREQEAERLEVLTAQVEDVEANATAYREVMASPHLTAEERNGLTTEQAVKDFADSVQNEVAQATAQEEKLKERKAQFEERHKRYQPVARRFGEEPLTDALQRLRQEEEDADTALQACKAEEGRCDRRLDRVGKRLDRVEADGKDARVELETLGTGATALEQVRETHGADTDPGDLLQSLEDARARADAALSDNRALRNELEQKKSAAANNLAQQEQAARTLAEELARLDSLAADAEAFAIRVPTEAPEGYQDRLEGQHKAARQKGITAAAQLEDLEPLVTALDAFTAAHPGTKPQTWLQDIVRRREVIAIRIKDLEKDRDIKARQLQKLRDTKLAPSSVDLEVERLIGVDSYQPLHKVLDAADTAPARKEALLSALSAILHAPVFDDAEAAAQAARHIADADIPVPVLLRAEVERIALADGMPVSRAGLLHSLLLSGIRTPTVDLLIDPAAVARRIADFEAAIERLSEQIEELEDARAVIADDAYAVVQARQAARAVAEDAVAKADRAKTEMVEAERRVAVLDGLLTPDLIGLSRRAAAYAAAGGTTHHEQCRARHAAALDAAATFKAQQEWAAERLDEAQAAEETLGEARDRARDAITTWRERCTQAADFLAEGGLPALESAQRRVHGFERRLDLGKAITSGIHRARDAARTATNRANDHLRQASAARSEWQEPLQAAIKFEGDGGPAFLRAYPADKARAEARTTAARHRAALPFEKAAGFIAAGGGDERARIIKERGELQASVTRRRDRLRALEADRLIAEDRHATARQRLEKYDFGIRQLLDIHPEIRKVYSDPVLRVDVESAPVGGVAAEIMSLAQPVGKDGPSDVTPEAIASAMHDIVERARAADLPALSARLLAAQDKREAAYRDYAHHLRGRLAGLRERLPTGFEGILQRIAEAENEPRAIDRLFKEQDVALTRQKSLLSAAQSAEARNRDTLQQTLQNQSSIAAQSIATLRRVLQKGDGATFLLVDDEVASDEAIASMVKDIIERVEVRKQRHEEDAAKGRAQGDVFSDSFRTSIRDDLHDNLFPSARIHVRHPLMRGGTEFPLIKEGISGGQSTALNLLWAIKLAAFAVERETSHLTGAHRRKAAAAAQSIIIVDGLFSDLSEPGLIAESLDAMKEIKGNFQLIGLIHSPYYRNDWEFFPTCLNGRHIDSDEEGGNRKTSLVMIEGVPKPNNGRVRTTSLRAVNTLAAS